MKRLDGDEAFIRMREQEVERILQQMKDIAKLYNDLAEMVVQQGELIDQIDVTIAEAKVNVDRGIELIEEAVEEEGPKERNMLKTILIAIIVLTVIVVLILLFSKTVSG